MSEAASPLWTAEQHGWLAALGHAVYVRGALPNAFQQPEAGQAAAEAAPQPAPVVASERTLAPRRIRTAPPSPPAFVRESAPTARRPASRLPDRLHIALIRAAGINPNAPGMAELIAQWPSSSELRGDPAAKRALWPRLRALRKGQPG